MMSSLCCRLGLEADHEPASTVPGIDTIVGSRSRIPFSAPVLIRPAILVQAGYDEEWFGRLAVSFGAPEQAAHVQVTSTTLGPKVQDAPVPAALMTCCNFPHQRQHPTRGRWNVTGRPERGG